MSDTSVAGRVVNVTVGGHTFDMAEDDSIDYDAGESVNDFEPAAKTISESFHEVASPTLSWDTTVDPDAAGLEAVGVVEGDDIVISGSRRVEDVTLEYLDADDGTVEGKLDIPAATVEWEGFDGQTPVNQSFTLHVNEQPTYTADPAA